MSNEWKDVTAQGKAIIDGYFSLSEDSRRAISQSVYRHDAALFRRWLLAAKCKGFRDTAAAARPPALRGKLDRALHRSELGPTLRKDVFSCFFKNEHPEWIEYVQDQINGATNATVEHRLLDILETPSSPFAKSELRNLFAARSLLRPHDWLGNKKIDGSRLDAKAASSVGPAPRHVRVSIQPILQSVGPDLPSAEPTDAFAQLDAAILDVQRGIAAATCAKPFALDHLIDRIKFASELGERIRAELARLQADVPAEGLEWITLDELRVGIRGLAERKRAAKLSEVRKSRIAAVSEVLKNISEFKIKSAINRARVEQSRLRAIEELRSAEHSEVAPALYGEAYGTDWLREILALSGSQFDSALEAVNKSGFRELADFLSVVESWDRIAFEENNVSVLDKTGTMPPSTSTHPFANKPVFGIHIEQEEAKATSPRPKQVIEEFTSTAKPALPVASGKMDEDLSRPTDGECVSRPSAPDSGVPPPATLGGAHPRKVNYADHLVAVRKYAERGRWATCAHYSRILACPKLAPPSIFNTLALLPHIGADDSSVSEAVRRELEKCEPLDRETDTTALVICGAALIPACLLVPFSSAPSHLRTIHWPERLSALNVLSQATIRLLEVVPHCSAQLLQGSQPRQVWDNQLREIAFSAEEFDRDAQKLSMMYQPATESWKYLVKQGTIRETVKQLRAVGGTGDKSKVREFLTVSDGQKNILKLVDAIHRQREPHSRTRIEARAIPQFESKIAPLRELAAKWLQLTENVPLTSDAVSERLGEYRRAWITLAERATDCAATCLEGPGSEVAVSAIKHAFTCVQHVVNGGLTTSVSLEATDAIAKCLLLVPGLSFDAQRTPSGTQDSQLAALSAGADEELSLVVVAERRVASKDILGTKHTIALLETQRQVGVETLRTSFDHMLIEKRSEVRGSLRNVRRQAARARLSGMIGEGDSAELEAAFVGIEKDSREDDLLGFAGEAIDLHAVKLNERTALGKSALLARVRSEVIDPNDRERLERLIELEDATTVHEYLSRLATGQKLPKESSTNLRPFSDFTPERQRTLQAALAEGGELDGLKTAMRAAKAFASIDFSKLEKEERQRDVTWLDAWTKVKLTQRPEIERVEVLLSGLGYIVHSVKTAPSGIQQMSEARVQPLCDRTLCPIPRFGSGSGGVIVVRHIWTWTDEEALVQSIGETVQHQHLNLVIYYGRLGPERRMAVARICRAKRRSFVVLDELLLTHLCGRNEARLGAFFRAAAPYTFADPFVTASSLVPPEMFFGREEELAALMSSDNGRCFVYGGRQLGKTALLREAERRFHNPATGNFASWVDLQNHGIGRENQPNFVWEVILREFSRWPGFPESSKSTSHKSDAGAADLIELWLEKHPSRRVLLLLDEADLFLQEDAQENFREARRLKGIMDRTSRRFKVVFAGLHNVQRTTQQANHPLAHLGEPINVGALSKNGEWHSAFALAAEPLTALGVEFTSIDLVGRVLTLCNFYPGLIQQFCSRLWRSLLDKRVDGPPFPITENELDEVYHTDLRQDIVGRFKLTLQLDPRYWHLAHVVALGFLENASRAADQGYSVTQLRDMAMEWWSEGFSNHTLEEFRSILDEMCDLGVFRASAGRYNIRNANILLLLGTRSEVETEVITGPRKIAEYKPRSFRARLKARDPLVRRPLTLSEEGRLCHRSNGVAYVVGSQALELDSVGASLIEVADTDRANTISSRVKDAAAFKDELGNIASASRNNGEGLFLVWVPAALNWSKEWVTIAQDHCDRLRSPRRFIRLVFEVAPEQLWDSTIPFSPAGVEESEKILTLKKWSPDFVAPYLVELGVPGGDQQIAEVMEATGGWPALVHELGRRFFQMGDWRRALNSLSERPVFHSDTAASKFIGASKRATGALGVLKTLHSQLNAGEPIHDGDLAVHAELLGVSHDHLQNIVDVGQRLGLVDRTQVGLSSWDRVFERLVLA